MFLYLKLFYIYHHWFTTVRILRKDHCWLVGLLENCKLALVRFDSARFFNRREHRTAGDPRVQHRDKQGQHEEREHFGGQGRRRGRKRERGGGVDQFEDKKQGRKGQGLELSRRGAGDGSKETQEKESSAGKEREKGEGITLNNLPQIKCHESMSLELFDS